jgi:CheY-like chemotaxis protein
MDPTPEMTKRKLLLADDSVTIRKVVELTFAEEGIEVISATNGDEAMQRFVERTPDIVLVDVEMPGMSGYKICEMIKGDESTKDIPVLLLVGSFEPFDQDEAERVLADGFLMKPFHSIRELVAKVNELLGEDGAGLPTPDTVDIEDLYTSSFAQTVPLDIDDTEEDLSEVSYVTDETVEELPLEQESSDDSAPAENVLEIAPAEATQPYLDNELPDMQPVSQEPIEEDLGEPSFDDEIVETVHAAPSTSSNGSIETVPAEDAFDSTVRDFDWSPEAKVTAEDEPTQPETVSDPQREPEPTAYGSEEGARLSLVPDNAYIDPAIHDSISDTEEFRSPYAVNEIDRAAEPVKETTEPSRLELTEDTINLLAKRIVEKLSDRVVRDIAQEAVPRIAEKLIREALDDEGKG